MHDGTQAAGLMAFAQIAEDGFRQFKDRQEKSYNHLAKTYALWSRFNGFCVIICLLFYSITLDRLYWRLFLLHFILGFIATGLMAYTETLRRTFCHMQYCADTKLEILNAEDCRRWKHLVFYDRRVFYRLGVFTSALSPGYVLISCPDYQFIVEVMPESDI